MNVCQGCSEKLGRGFVRFLVDIANNNYLYTCILYK